MADFPILFTFSHVVKGPSFEAIVKASGRLLIAEEEPGDWWCHGVEPGGLTVQADGAALSFAKFSASFRHALEDLAELASSREEFEEEACALFNSDAHDAKRWDAALERIQHVEIPEEFRNLPRKVWNESVLEVLPLEGMEKAPMEAVREEHSLPEAA